MTSQLAREQLAFRRLALGTLLAMVALLASHGGEFWPFSIFPMFSRGGRAWSRPIVQDVSGSEPASWTRTTLIGQTFPLGQLGLDQNDFGKLILGFGESLEPDEASLLANMFQSVRARHDLLLYRVSGELLSNAGVRVAHQPIIVIDRHGVRSLGRSLR